MDINKSGKDRKRSHDRLNYEMAHPTSRFIALCGLCIGRCMQNNAGILILINSPFEALLSKHGYNLTTVFDKAHVLQNQ